MRPSQNWNHTILDTLLFVGVENTNKMSDTHSSIMQFDYELCQYPGSIYTVSYPEDLVNTLTLTSERPLLVPCGLVPMVTSRPTSLLR
jgi:hypothetical protein